MVLTPAPPRRPSQEPYPALAPDPDPDTDPGLDLADPVLNPGPADEPDRITTWQTWPRLRRIRPLAVAAAVLTAATGQAGLLTWHASPAAPRPPGRARARHPAVVIHMARARQHRRRQRIAQAIADTITAAVGGGAALAALMHASTPASAPSANVPARAVHTGFVGYRWTVTAISRSGAAVPIPADWEVILVFFNDGQFVGNEPANGDSGPFRLTSDGFTTDQLTITMERYAGSPNSPAGLSVGAIDAFSGYPSTRAIVDVTGDRMVVMENGYTLTCVRAAKVDDLAPSPNPPAVR